MFRLSISASGDLRLCVASFSVEQEHVDDRRVEFSLLCLVCRQHSSSHRTLPWCLASFRLPFVRRSEFRPDRRTDDGQSGTRRRVATRGGTRSHSFALCSTACLLLQLRTLTATAYRRLAWPGRHVRMADGRAWHCRSGRAVAPRCASAPREGTS